jgi:glycosyltransferase involved in cell wall biosynthesis
VHHGIDELFLTTEPAGNGSGSPYLLAVATEEPRKDLCTLLEAFAILKRRGFEGSLKIAGGPGIDTPRVVETIRRLGLEREVSRLGYVDARELPSLYRNARALVSPSLSEGFGLPLLEAMASTTRSVAPTSPCITKSPTTPRVRPPSGSSSLVVSASAPMTLSGRVSARGIERVRAFSWTTAARRRSLFRSLAGS